MVESNDVRHLRAEPAPAGGAGAGSDIAAVIREATGYAFTDAALLQRAFTHRSHSASHNERLEFLGDSALNCAVALVLYHKFPEVPEGELSRLRASLVSEGALAAVAQRLGLSRYLRLGEGELKTGGSHRPSILADALEALLGAVLLDGGFAAAQAVVERVYGELLASVSPAAADKDPKTRLQEVMQGAREVLPRYTVVTVRGAAHAQEFEVECLLEPRGIRAIGRGSSRRRAEQDAAAHALQQLDKR